MHSEKRVNILGKSKKIVLFIVEGITDEISLSLILSKIIEKDKIVKFKIINGDVTSEYGTKLSNILIKITDKIKEFIVKDIYKKTDIQNIIHLVDIDGAYIDGSLILQKDIDGFEYDTQNIYAKNVEDVRKRNEQKSGILNKLIGTDKVYTDLSYRIYFFSSNLEHVLHNNQKVSESQKNEYAQMFEDKFADEPYRFIEFINKVEIAVNGDYKDTWDFIKKDTNSLNRYTNFHICINDILLVTEGN